MNAVGLSGIIVFQVGNPPAPVHELAAGAQMNAGGYYAGVNADGRLADHEGARADCAAAGKQAQRIVGVLSRCNQLVIDEGAAPG